MWQFSKSKNTPPQKSKIRWGKKKTKKAQVLAKSTKTKNRLHHPPPSPPAAWAATISPFSSWHFLMSRFSLSWDFFSARCSFSYSTRKRSARLLLGDPQSTPESFGTQDKGRSGFRLPPHPNGQGGGAPTSNLQRRSQSDSKQRRSQSDPFLTWQCTWPQSFAQRRQNMKPRQC